MTESQGFVQADDLIGMGWGVPTFSQRGNMTELVTVRALDITEICTRRSGDIKRVVLLAARTEGIDRGLIQLAQWSGDGARRMLTCFNPSNSQGWRPLFSGPAATLGLDPIKLEQAIRRLADRAGIRLA
jgi:hypothetical protein